MQNYEYAWSNSADNGHTLLHFPEGAGTSRGLRILFLIKEKVEIRNSWYRLLPGSNATGTFAHFRRYLSGALSERLQIW